MLVVSFGDPEERRRLRGRSDVIGSVAARTEDAGRGVGGVACAVESNAGGLLGMSEVTVGSAVVSGEVEFGVLSPSRTEI